MEAIRKHSPRAEGIREQYQRAKQFTEEAQASKDPVFQFRLYVAAIYFARAIVELVLEATDKQEIKKTRKEAVQSLRARLPRYALIETVRIHDFHRFGLVDRSGIFIGGPLKLRASGKGGIAAILVGLKGLIRMTSKSSTIKEQRILQTRDGKVYDEEKEEWISIEQALTEYIEAVPAVLNEEFQIEVEATGEIDYPFLGSP